MAIGQLILEFIAAHTVYTQDFQIKLGDYTWNRLALKLVDGLVSRAKPSVYPLKSFNHSFDKVFGLLQPHIKQNTDTDKYETRIVDLIFRWKIYMMKAGKRFHGPRVDLNLIHPRSYGQTPNGASCQAFQATVEKYAEDNSRSARKLAGRLEDCLNKACENMEPGDWSFHDIMR